MFDYRRTSAPAEINRPITEDCPFSTTAGSIDRYGQPSRGLPS
ncbi:hypothetical protein HPGCJGGD_0165 [Methylobacterium haplocladii]|nr:hypothetical protein HPGCJGGD_0165 [Methylobacterium haplocladii]